MLTLLKKNAAQAKKDAGTPWRADFRIAELLPDTKTVRTAFLVNLVAITLLGSLVLFGVYRETKLNAIKKEIEIVQSRIDSLKGANSQAETQFKQFQVEEKKLKQIQALAVAEFSFPDFLVHLASLMPKGVRSNRLNYRGVGQTISVAGTIDGLDAAASETASAFVNTLQNDETFRKMFSSINNSNLSRNTATNTLNFDLVFTFAKPSPAKK